MSKMFNLDEKINLIYNFNYNSEYPNCYKLDKLNHNNIVLDDIKVTTKNKILIDEILTDLMKGNFILENFDEKTGTTSIKRFSNEFPLMINITPYKKAKESMNMSSLSNNDAYHSFLLSNLVLNKKTNHILLPIVNVDARFNQIADVLNKFDSFEYYMNEIQNGKISDLFSINVKENFFKSENLEKYMKDNDFNLKPLLFQLIHTLAIIQKDYPNFRHNSLSPSNVMIYLRNELNNKDSVKYSYEKKKFYLKNYNLDIKLTNFVNSNLDNKNNNSKIPFMGKSNRYFDLHYFLNTLLYKFNLKNIDKESVDFINRILPKKVRGKGKNNFYLEKNEELFIPEKILEDKYFNDYKKISGNLYMINSNNYFMGLNVESKKDYKEFFGNQSENGLKLMMKGNRKINKEKIDKHAKKSKRYNGRKKYAKLNRKLVKMTGGGEKHFQKPYKRENNDPFVSNDSRQVYSRKKDEQPKRKEPRVIAEQVVYDTSKPSKPPVDHHPLYVPINNNYYPYYGKLEYPYNKINNTKVPVQKIYNINLANPSGDHTTLNRVYEDMIPGDPFALSFNSVNERKQFINSTRNSILNERDGEEMNITGGENSLLSFLRLAELNPYALGTNPYKELSRGFIIYNCAYPIRRNRERNSLEYAKGAVGLNARLYKMSLGAYRANTISKDINFDNFDLWREIRYYEYVKNTITKKKISPNFINLILYKIDSKSRIDWDKLEALLFKGRPEDVLRYLNDKDDKINNLHTIKSRTNLVEDYVSKIKMSGNLDLYKLKKDSDASKSVGVFGLFKGHNFDPSDRLYYKVDERNNKIRVVKLCMDGTRYEWDNNNQEWVEYRNNISRNWTKCTNLKKCLEKEDLTANSNRSLIALTESPTHNIIKWGSSIYESNGSIKTMIATGHHTKSVWKSILFQLVYTMAVLQEHEIYFERMSLDNNIFIKDIFTKPESINHWIYKVDGVEFYIPNYGHVLVFDSRYVDIHKELIINCDDLCDDKNIYKISSKIFNKRKIDRDGNVVIEENNGGRKNSEIKGLILDSFKNMFKKDEFLYLLKKHGGNKPADEVVDLMDKIYEDSEVEIKNYLLKYFKEFMNNRVGTLLTVEEYENINMMIPPKFKKGGLAVLQERFNEYKWVMVLGESKNSRKIRIINDINNDPIEVFRHKMMNYPEIDTIEPISDGRMNLGNKDVIEIYELK